MNKNILKVFIATIILLIGIGAVSAIDYNNTDDLTVIDEENTINVKENSEIVEAAHNENESLATENNAKTTAVNENDSESLSAENNAKTTAVNENNSEVLTAESESEKLESVNTAREVLTVSSDDDKLSLLYHDSPASHYTQSKTQYKTFTLGKVKIPKKYKSILYKTPSKKNKKAWNLYKQFKKFEKKAMKKLKKSIIKVIKKAVKSHWHGYGDVKYKLKWSGNYYVLTFYQKAYRTYNYNPLLNKSWWD